MSLTKVDLYQWLSPFLVRLVAQSKPFRDLILVTLLFQSLVAYLAHLGWPSLCLTRVLVLHVSATNLMRPEPALVNCNYTAATDWYCSDRCQVLPHLPLRHVLYRRQLCPRCLCCSYLSLDRSLTDQLKPCYRCLIYLVFHRLMQHVQQNVQGQKRLLDSTHLLPLHRVHQ